MNERMTEERLEDIRALVTQFGLSSQGMRQVWRYAHDDLLPEIDALRAELAEARLAAAVADGTATPEMLRDAGLLEEWTPRQDGIGYSLFIKWVGSAYCRRDRWGVAIGDGASGEECSTLANLRAADAAVRELLAEGEDAG